PVRLLPRLLVLETPGVQATVPLMRGVWGAALHDLDSAAYRTVFNPAPADGPPGYLLRPAPPDPPPPPPLSWCPLRPALDPARAPRAGIPARRPPPGLARPAGRPPGHGPAAAHPPLARQPAGPAALVGAPAGRVRIARRQRRPRTAGRAGGIVAPAGRRGLA